VRREEIRRTREREEKKWFPSRGEKFSQARQAKGTQKKKLKRKILRWGENVSIQPQEEGLSRFGTGCTEEMGYLIRGISGTAQGSRSFGRDSGISGLTIREKGHAISHKKEKKW